MNTTTTTTNNNNNNHDNEGCHALGAEGLGQRGRRERRLRGDGRQLPGGDADSSSITRMSFVCLLD